MSHHAQIMTPAALENEERKRSPLDYDRQETLGWVAFAEVTGTPKDVNSGFLHAQLVVRSITARGGRDVADAVSGCAYTRNGWYICLVCVLVRIYIYIYCRTINMDMYLNIYVEQLIRIPCACLCMYM